MTAAESFLTPFAASLATAPPFLAESSCAMRVLLGSKTSSRREPFFITSTPTMVREWPWCWKYSGGTKSCPARDLRYVLSLKLQIISLTADIFT